jgi:hypothetical protein
MENYKIEYLTSKLLYYILKEKSKNRRLDFPSEPTISDVALMEIKI